MVRINYKIKDIDAIIIVEKATRKEILALLDEYVDNLKYDWFDGSDDAFYILYKDGSEDCLTSVNYDGHKIKRTNIVSMVNSNASTYIVYGDYSINEYGVVSPSKCGIILDDNIMCLGIEDD